MGVVTWVVVRLSGGEVTGVVVCVVVRLTAGGRSATETPVAALVLDMRCMGWDEGPAVETVRLIGKRALSIDCASDGGIHRALGFEDSLVELRDFRSSFADGGGVEKSKGSTGGMTSSAARLCSMKSMAIDQDV